MERLCLAAMEALDCGDTDTTTSFCSSGWLSKIVCWGVGEIGGEGKVAWGEGGWGEGEVGG